MTASAPQAAQDDWRKGHLDFRNPNLSRIWVVERLREIGPATTFLLGSRNAWTLHPSAVTGAIVGARNASKQRSHARRRFAPRDEEITR